MIRFLLLIVFCSYLCGSYQNNVNTYRSCLASKHEQPVHNIDQDTKQTVIFHAAISKKNPYYDFDKYRLEQQKLAALVYHERQLVVQQCKRLEKKHIHFDVVLIDLPEVEKRKTESWQPTIARRLIPKRLTVKEEQDIKYKQL